MQIDVVENAKRNIILGIVNRIILLLLPFVERTIIHSILGSQYLGLGSLFTSLISVLSLTELGFASAMVYNMYKPVAEEDIQKINSLLNYYKKVYRVIGCTILSLGSILIPFLSSFIKGSYPKEINLITLYSLNVIKLVADIEANF